MAVKKGSRKALSVPCDNCGLDCPVKPRGRTTRPFVAFISGEPTSTEVAQGKVLLGEGNRLLSQILTSMGEDISQFLFTTAVAWRPTKENGDDRDATIEEIRACTNPRLWDSLLDAEPTLLVPLGNAATTALLGSGAGITRRRGVYKEIEIDDQRFGVFPTIHPQKVFAAPDFYIDLVNDLEKALAIARGELEPVIEPPYVNYLIANQKIFDAMIRRLAEVPLVAIDLETGGNKPGDGLDPGRGRILSASFSWARGSAVVVDWQALIENNQRNFNKLKRALENVDSAFHNGQFDVMWLNSRNIWPRYVFDTMLASYCLDERKGVHGLKRLSTDRYRAPEYDKVLKKLLKESREDKISGAGVTNEGEDRKSPLVITLEDWKKPAVRLSVMKYNGADSDYTFRLAEDLRQEMIDDDVLSVHDEILIPAAHHFLELERIGMKVDVEYHNSKAAEWQREIEAIEKDLYRISGTEGRALTPSGGPWWSSWQQLAKYLYDVLKLRQMNAKKDTLTQSEVLDEIQALEDVSEEANEYWHTASSAVFSNMTPRSTNTYMLYWLGHQHEFPRLMTKWRLLAKKLGTYYHGYREIMRTGNRIHPRYRLHGARTGRISSTDPNIHGMPRLKEIKRLFVADDGFILISADYSQAEIRMLAHLSGDEVLRQACEGDIHRSISKQLFHVTDEQLDAMTEERRTFLRRAAKTIAFGIIYGRMPKSLAPQLGVSVEEATLYRTTFLRQLPKASRWIERQKVLVRRDQEVRSLYGRKRRFPVILHNRHMNDIERQAVNMPVQSPVSDMTLLANIRIMNRLRSEGIEVRPWPHIHDGFLFQVEKTQKDRAIEVTIEEMHDVGFETTVKFAVELAVGDSWGTLKTVYEG